MEKLESTMKQFIVEIEEMLINNRITDVMVTDVNFAEEEIAHDILGNRLVRNVVFFRGVAIIEGLHDFQFQCKKYIGIVSKPSNPKE
jgi:hypothetical protein